MILSQPQKQKFFPKNRDYPPPPPFLSYLIRVGCNSGKELRDGRRPQVFNGAKFGVERLLLVLIVLRLKQIIVDGAS